jgi:hypothetical protein
VSRQQSSSLSFAARIRDTSRSGEGAELPIVRERDFRRGHIVLPGVTVEPGSRTTLRLYSIDEIPSFTIELSGEGINPIFTGTSFAGGATVAATKATGDAPWIATIDVASVIQRRYLDGDFGPFRIDITARPPFSRIWAMVSITNNDTQRVTIVSPH